jgi:hypothetical protein
MKLHVKLNHRKNIVDELKKHVINLFVTKIGDVLRSV